MESQNNTNNNTINNETSKPSASSTQNARRDKFASMAAQQQQQQQASKPPARRGKFAKLAAAKKQQASSTTTDTTTQQDANEEQQVRQKLQDRLQQRSALLKDVKEAEGLTFQLLELASSTTQALSEMDFDQDQISKTSNKYGQVLQKIHDILSPHAQHVVCYQNHKVDYNNATVQQETENDIEKLQQPKNNSNNNMYAARVEMRLAMERQFVLEELLRLEKEEKNQDAMIQDSSATSRKRQREE